MPRAKLEKPKTKLTIGIDLTLLEKTFAELNYWRVNNGLSYLNKGECIEFLAEYWLKQNSEKNQTTE
ncbi:MAG: hypothetical protein ACRCZ2_02955 [Fusobacteriaceae bacterium]